jgi:hypothetical protein
MNSRPSQQCPVPYRLSRAAGPLHRGASRIAGLVLLVGCGAEDTPARFTSPADAAMYEGPPFFERDEPTAVIEPPTVPADDGLGGLVDGPSQEQDPPTCLIQQASATLVRQPVDIVLLLDNSGSMSDELGAVEANINVNFASILANSDVDYRVILISRHRQEPRDESEEASTSICVSSPLSGLEDCSEADAPVGTNQFFQYSTKLESTDSFDVLIDTYEPPFDGSEREEKFDRAPLGWSDWLRAGAKKVFLEMTDDDEDMPIEEFVAALMAMGPEHFGTDPASPTFVFHSIIGLAEKFTPTAAYLPHEPVQPATCTGNDNEVQNAGESYQELSRLTGGLRFPLCQFGAYDVVFQRIAADVVERREIECDFELPAPPEGREFDLDNVAIAYSPGDGAEAVKFGQALTLEDCLPDAFYIAQDRLNLCPSTCAAVRRDPVASVTVLFTCESQLIVPR